MTTCGYDGRGEHYEHCPWPEATMNRIDWLALHGSSLNISWDSDADYWEVAWITLGTRHTAVRRGLHGALQRVYDVGALGPA